MAVFNPADHYRAAEATTAGRYERFASSTDLTVSSFQEALARLGFTNPVLHVHPGALGVAREVASHFAGAAAIVIDDTIEDEYEWYIEWNGRRIGSEGA